MRQTKASRNSQLYSEHQTIYTLRVKNNHLSNVHSHKDKAHVAKSCFSLGVYYHLIESAPLGRKRKHIPCFMILSFEETEVTLVLLFWHFLTSSPNSPQDSILTANDLHYSWMN